MAIFTKPEDYQPADIASFMQSMVNEILYFSAVIAGIMIVWGGLKIIASSGNEEQVTAGKNIVKWAMIGLVVISLSYTLVNFALRTFQVRDLQNQKPTTTTPAGKIEYENKTVTPPSTPETTTP